MSQRRRHRPPGHRAREETPAPLPPASAAVRWGTVALAIVLVAAAVAMLALEALRDPKVVLLAGGGPARWITVPLEPGVSVRDGFYARPTVRFSRRFDVAAPGAGTLSLRAFEACSVRVNGRQVFAGAPGANWKSVRRVDLAGALVPGADTIEIVVHADYGPPCLWARVEMPGASIATDTTWSAALDGLPAVAAVIADDTGLVDLNRGAPAPWEALARRLPALFAVFALALGLAILWRSRAASKLPRPGPRAALAVALAGWVALFAFNGARLPVWTGFDMPGHLAYVEYLLEHHALPPLREGWESHHPPLFYLFSAALLGAARAVSGAGQALWSLRIVPFLAGLGQIALAWVAARRLFGRHGVAVAAAVAFAALVPMNLYLSRYVSNEPLAGFTGGLVTLAALAVIARDRPGRRDFLLLGAAMGLAVGTKVSGWIPVLAAAAVVLAGLAAERARRAARLAAALGAMAAAGLACGGWAYVRNWIVDGTPLVSPWRGGIAYAWWQDPGFHTPGWFLEFGRVFRWPAFSAFYSFWDSVYATFWGDWLCGGMGGFEARPPWDYGWMAALLPLGLPVTVLIAGGFVASCAKALRGDRARLLLVAVVMSLGFGLVELNLRLPYYGHAKAFFGLGGLLALALMFAEGTAWVLARAGSLRAAAVAVFWAYLATLAVAVGLSFHVRADDPQRHLHLGWQLERDNRLDDAAREFEAALRVAPDHGLARGELAHTLALLGRMPDAARQFETAVRLRPRDAEVATRDAVVLGELGRNDEAMARLERALAIDPANAQANVLYAQHLAVRGRDAEALVHARRALAIEPANQDARRLLEALADGR